MIIQSSFGSTDSRINLHIGLVEGIKVNHGEMVHRASLRAARAACQQRLDAAHGENASAKEAFCGTVEAFPGDGGNGEFGLSASARTGDFRCRICCATTNPICPKKARTIARNEATISSMMQILLIV